MIRALICCWLVGTGSAAAQFYTEDFADGLPAGWTTEDASSNAQSVLFQYCTQPADCPPASQPFPPDVVFASNTAANGYLFADADAAGTQPEPFDTYLTTAPISVPAATPELWLTFESFLSTNDFPAATNASLEVRAAGSGDVWTLFYPYCELGEGDDFNQTSENPRTVEIDLSDFAAANALELRWHWRGKREWTWAIDDVRLFGENPRFRNAVWGTEPGQGDFANGLGEWTLNNINLPAPGQHWQYEPTADLSPALLAPEDRHARTPTRCNGAMILNADFYTTGGAAPPPAPPFPIYVSELISPIIDLSGVDGKLSLRFSQSAKQLDAAPGYPGTTSWAFSTDGGATWSAPVAANPDLEQQETRDRTSTFPLPADANGAAEFRIKFTFAGNLFWWVIDDVLILRRPSDDLALLPDTQVLPPSVLLPASQVQGVYFGSEFENAGNDDATNVQLRAEVWQSGTVLFADSTEFAEVLSDEVIQSNLSELFIPEPEAQSYEIRYLITSDSTDQAPGNDTIRLPFVVTDTTFAKETGGTRGIAPNLPNGAVAYEYGNCFFVPNGTGLRASSISFALANAEDLAGKEVVTRLLEWEGDLNGDFFANNSEYTQIAQNVYEVQGDEGAALITIPVNFEPADLALTDGRYYIALIRYQEPPNTEPMFLRASEALDYNTTFFRYQELGTPRYFGILRTNFDSDDLSVAGFGLDVVPVVRLHIKDPAVDTWEPVSATSNWQILENPVRFVLTLRRTDELTHPVNYNIVDVSGRAIQTGVVRRNSEQITLDELSDGHYWLQIEGQTLPFVVMKN